MENTQVSLSHSNEVKEETKLSNEDVKSEADIRETRGRPKKTEEHIAELKLLDKAFRLEKNKLKKQIAEVEKQYKKDKELVALKYKTKANGNTEEKKTEADIETLMKENEELKAKLSGKSVKKVAKPKKTVTE